MLPHSGPLGSRSSAQTEPRLRPARPQEAEGESGDLSAEPLSPLPRRRASQSAEATLRAQGEARNGNSKLLVVANRLPVRRERRDGETVWKTSPGGLVSAMAPILEERGGAWIGWPGFPGEAPAPFDQDGFRLHPVGISKVELEQFYLGFSNGSLWPLYHDAVRFPEFHRRWWGPYAEINERFARATAEAMETDDATVWVHDYQLQLVPGLLRDLRPDARIGFFLHIPFPPVELFAQLPWRQVILERMLGADLLGFQTKFGAQNFARAARRFTSATGTDSELQFRGRTVRVGAHPISIDTTKFEDLAKDPAIRSRAEEIRAEVGRGRKIFLGVDRLDYTKGIDQRLRGFLTLLDRYENAAELATFVQIAVPSREMVPEYAQIRTQVEQQVSRINGTYGEPGRAAVHYLYRSVDVRELVAWYLAADVMVVSPLRDGMNLVAKEFVACRTDGDGVLVLSEFTGAAIELRQAITVNPHDVDGLASAYELALDLPKTEQRKRMAALRRVVRRRNVFQWADNFLADLSSTTPSASPEGNPQIQP